VAAGEAINEELALKTPMPRGWAGSGQGRERNYEDEEVLYL